MVQRAVDEIDVGLYREVFTDSRRFKVGVEK